MTAPDIQARLVEGPPALDWVRQPCPTCGRAQEDEPDNGLCLQSSDETGEYYCDGGDSWDAEGYRLYPTPESVARLDAYYGARQAEIEQDEAKALQDGRDG